ncbi:MAG: hypothetical protein H7841_14425 [Magnetospirillum sp. WYHS-4]
MPTRREEVLAALFECLRTIKVRPLTSPAYAMIQAQAEKVYENWAEHRAGAEGLDPADGSVRRGLMRALMIKGLALYAIADWQGVERSLRLHPIPLNPISFPAMNYRVKVHLTFWIADISCS